VIKRALLMTMLSCMLLTCRQASAQSSFCSAHPEKLACLGSGLFGSPQIDPLGPISSALGSQLGLIPLASPASGIIYSVDPSLGIPTKSTETFGPVLTERGETIGRHKLFAAFTYQRFTFNNFDGVDLKRYPLVFNVCDQGTGQCGVIATSNRVDAKINQFAFFGTFGLTDRIDVSIAVPLLHAKLGVMGSSCTICKTQVFSDGTQVIFTPAAVTGSATGVGDVVLRGKGLLWKGNRFRLAFGADLRFHTGDEFNFLGTGAFGVKPFVAASIRGRIAPHVNLGYQWNGDSAIAGRAPGVKGKLPDNLFYDGGFDLRVARKLTFAVDFLGERVFSAQRIVAVTTAGQPNIAIVHGSFNTVKGATGIKLNPIGNLLVTGNILVRMDHNGLRNQLVPLGGISYTF
jgi:hypothetical protein